MNILLEIKSNLYHKASLVVLTFLLFFTCLQCISFYQEHPHKDDTIQALDRSVQEERRNLTDALSEANSSDAELMPDAQKAIQKEFLKFMKSNLSRLGQQEAYAKSNETKNEEIMEFIGDVERMNYFSSKQKKDMPGTMVFQKELNSKDVQALLHNTLYQPTHKALVYNKDERHYMYEDSLQRARLAQYNIQHNQNTYRISAWNYMLELFGLGSLFTIIVPLLCLLYAAILIQEKLRTKSYTLYMQAHQLRATALFPMFLSIFLTFFLLLLLSILLPFLFVGLRYGFSGFQEVVLLQVDGLLGFHGYKHTMDCMQNGKYFFYQPTAINTLDVKWPYYMIPSALQWVPFSIVMIPFLVLLMGKLVFFTSIGIVSVLLVRHKALRSLLLLFWVVIYIVSMWHGFSFVATWNPFSIQSTWITTIGGPPTTWLNALLLFVVWSTVALGVTLYGVKKRTLF